MLKEIPVQFIALKYKNQCSETKKYKSKFQQEKVNKAPICVTLNFFFNFVEFYKHITKQVVL